MFENVQRYRGWRTKWRKAYKGVASTLHKLKQEARRPTNNSEAQAQVQSDIATLKAVAHSMMIARTSIDGLYRLQKGF